MFPLLMITEMISNLAMYFIIREMIAAAQDYRIASSSIITSFAGIKLGLFFIFCDNNID